MPHRSDVLIAALCASLSAGCAHDSPSPDGAAAPDAARDSDTFVGALDGSDVRIALVQGATTIEAYVCGKDETLQTHTRWFRGTASQRDAAGLALRAGTWTLRMEPIGEDLRGELESPEGVIESWGATRVAALGADEVGLYDAALDGCRTGVIVWQAEPGAACLAQGSYCDGMGQRSQVTPVLCEGDQPLRVRATRNGEPLELTVERVLVP
jgi:hypothetical protein